MKPELEKAQQDIKAAEEKLFSARQILESLQNQKPLEKEFRAGEWVPKVGQMYYYIASYGDSCGAIYANDSVGSYRLKTGNCYPTEKIAKAAQKHNDWWMLYEKVRVVHYKGKTSKIASTRIQDNGVLVHTDDAWLIYPTEIQMLGGEKVFAEMLNKGRVFRFKWGGE